MSGPSKPPAKELAAIAARAAAAGKKPTAAAILATYNRNQARAAAPKPSGRGLAEAAARRAGSTVTKPKASVRTARRPDERPPVPPTERPRHLRQPRGMSAAVTPEWRAAAVRQNERVRAEIAALDDRIGLSRNLEGLAGIAKSTPVTAYYALRGALGPIAGDAAAEAIYGRDVFDRLRRARPFDVRESDLIQAMAAGRVRYNRRPPDRRDE